MRVTTSAVGTCAFINSCNLVTQPVITAAIYFHGHKLHQRESKTQHLTFFILTEEGKDPGKDSFETELCFLFCFSRNSDNMSLDGATAMFIN